MNREDLLKMLDLAGTEAAGEGTTGLNLKPADATPPQPASPTALDLDEWGLRKGGEVLAGSPRLKSLDLGEHAVADFFACAFLPEPCLLPGCADPQRHDFIAQMLETPEYRALHAGTLLQEVPAAIAATAFAEQFAALKRAGPPERGSGGSDGADREMATLRAVGRALARATEEVEEARETAAALGMGPGAPGSNDPKAIAEVYRRVRNDPGLLRICTLAGRYRRAAQSKQRQKSVHGLDDVVGVTLGGEVSNLLPVELAKLAIPELEWDTLRRLVERQCLSREHQSVEPVAKGPIIVSVDESGSMLGEKAHTAKALALALAWVARRQHRWCALVAYSGDSGERLLALPPGRWDESALLDWLAGFIGRGSSLDVPVREMPDYYRRLKAPAGQTDVIFVTDARCRIPADLQARFLAWKQEVQARLVTLVVGSEPGDLATISDECHTVRTLAATEPAVGRVLSV